MPTRTSYSPCRNSRNNSILRKVSTSESRAQREESAAALRLYQERCLLRTMCRALTDTLSIDMNDMIPPFLRATGNKSELEVAAATAAASMVGSQGGTKLAFARPFVPPTQVPVWPGRCQRDSSSGGGAADSEDGEGKRVELHRAELDGVHVATRVGHFRTEILQKNYENR